MHRDHPNHTQSPGPLTESVQNHMGQTSQMHAFGPGATEQNRELSLNCNGGDLMEPMQHEWKMKATVTPDVPKADICPAHIGRRGLYHWPPPHRACESTLYQVWALLSIFPELSSLIDGSSPGFMARGSFSSPATGDSYQPVWSPQAESHLSQNDLFWLAVDPQDLLRPWFFISHLHGRCQRSRWEDLHMELQSFFISKMSLTRKDRNAWSCLIISHVFDPPRPTLSNSACQQLFRISGNWLIHITFQLTTFGWRCWGLNQGPSECETSFLRVTALLFMGVRVCLLSLATETCNRISEINGKARIIQLHDSFAALSKQGCKVIYVLQRLMTILLPVTLFSLVTDRLTEANSTLQFNSGKY